MKAKTKIKIAIAATCGFFTLYGIAGVYTTAPHEYKLPPPSQPTPVAGTDAQFLKAFSKVFSNISKEASPALVLIVAEKKVAFPQSNFPDDFFFPFLPPQFGGPGGGPGRPDKRKEGVETDAGSGFIVDLHNGYVITNNHVIDGADKITVTNFENKKFSAKLVGSAQKLDIAVLKLENFKASAQLKQLSLADSDQIDVGDWVVALGAPFDLPQTLTMGVVSALKRSSDTLGINGPNNFIQTDAPINPGNSGGPLVNLDGQVVGMNTAIYSKNGGSVGIGFAIPSNTIRFVADAIINKGKITQAYLGIEMSDVNKLSNQALKDLGVDQNTEGGLVMKVVPDSPADKAGLEPYDIIQSIDGKEVHSPSDIQGRVMFLTPGTAVKIGVLRNNAHKDLVAKVTEYPNSNEEASTGAERKTQQQKNKIAAEYGLTLAPRKESKKGVLISDVSTGSVADMAGLQSGDVILQVNKSNVSSVEDVAKKIESAKKANSGTLFLLVLRPGKKMDSQFAVFLQID